MLNPEHWLVPYQLAELPPGPWLVFAPHADDETFGMGGSLLKAQAAGIETHVVVVTDGSLGGDAGDLVAIRKQEVWQACEILGVKTLTCWSEQDRGLELSTALVAKFVEVIRAIKPGSVFFPAALELHPDHRNTAGLAWAALQQMKQEQDELPVPYGYEISVQSPINQLLDITEVMATKQKAMQVYASQNSQNNYLELIVALNKTRTFTLPESVAYAEGLMRFATEDLNRSLREVSQDHFDLYW